MLMKRIRLIKLIKSVVKCMVVLESLPFTCLNEGVKQFYIEICNFGFVLHAQNKCAVL